MKLVIKNGSIYQDGKFIVSDILIEHKKIINIGKNLQAPYILDAKDLLVFPGFIDIHVHFRDFGQEYKEDWISASKAALSGGITTVFDMPNNILPIINTHSYNKKVQTVKKKSLVNFGLYIAAINENINEINKSNARFVKLYYGNTTGNISANNTDYILKNLDKDKFLVVHAEDNTIMNENKSKFSPDSEKYHSLIRSTEAETKAVKDLITLVKKHNRQLHFTHISSGSSIIEIAKAKKLGLPITSDTCPQYLFLNDSMYKKLGTKLKFNPAVKSKNDQEKLWEHIQNGVIDCICTDHAPHTLEEKNQPYNTCPSGVPGIETMIPLLLTQVHKKIITFDQLVSLVVTNPCTLFTIKNKGKIAVGYDADITIVDPNKKWTLAKEHLKTKVKWSPFEGTEMIGEVNATLVAGHIGFSNNVIPLKNSHHCKYID